MGLFSRNSESRAAETSYSREWLSRTNGRPRKVELAVAVIARMAQGPLGSASAWGGGLDGGGLTAAAALLDDAIQQDRSLVGHVARDLVLLFEANGGIAANRGASLESVGLASSSAFEDAPGSPSEHAAKEATAIARAIRSRREGGEATPPDLTVYRALFEDGSDLGYQRAIGIGAWSGSVVARLATAGRLSNGALFLEPGMDYVMPMEQAGWFPNPVNPGETSSGEASIERWWDGGDWTDRVRIREGRRWQAVQASLLSLPSN
jgi:Protein of unknown function (DUF2510)